jgi:hypothetical protein
MPGGYSVRGILEVTWGAQIMCRRVARGYRGTNGVILSTIRTWEQRPCEADKGGACVDSSLVNREDKIQVTSSHEKVRIHGRDQADTSRDRGGLAMIE